MEPAEGLVASAGIDASKLRHQAQLMQSKASELENAERSLHIRVKKDGLVILADNKNVALKVVGKITLPQVDMPTMYCLPVDGSVRIA